MFKVRPTQSTTPITLSQVLATLGVTPSWHCSTGALVDAMGIDCLSKHFIEDVIGEEMATRGQAGDNTVLHSLKWIGGLSTGVEVAVVMAVVMAVVATLVFRFTLNLVFWFDFAGDLRLLDLRTKDFDLVPKYVERGAGILPVLLLPLLRLDGEQFEREANFLFVAQRRNWAVLF